MQKGRQYLYRLIDIIGNINTKYSSRIIKFVVAVVLLLTTSNIYALDWNASQGIPEDVSITSINSDGLKTYAFGIRMWMEDNQMKSEPRSFISSDNGKSWEVFMTIQNDLSTISAFLMSNNRLITCGRKGQAQLDWIGGVYYTDNNGESWFEAKGIPKDVSINKFQKNGNILMAVGQRIWREGTNFLSEPRCFISNDNGMNWSAGIKITDQISTCNSVLENDERIIVSGRFGPTQLDWIGAVMYTDDEGVTWYRSKGLDDDIAITEIRCYNGKLYAIGQKQWRDGMAFLSEAKYFVSEDNGVSWTPGAKIGLDLTSASTLNINNNIFITAGRKGQAQFNWIGEVIYTNIP